MNKQIGYVITDHHHHYISGKQTFVLTDDGWKYITFSGLCTGFTGYNNKKIAEIKMVELKNVCKQYGFNKVFRVEYIHNFNKIPKGKMIIENLFSLAVDRNVIKF